MFNSFYCLSNKILDKSKVFDDYALEYDQWFDEHPLEYSLELRTIQELLPQQGVGIEVGAGTGRFTQPLGISLAVEPSEAMRKIAVNRGINAIQGVAEALPFESASCDFVLMVTTVCFLEQPELAFEEASRVLKSAGCIVLGIIDRQSRLGKKYEASRKTSRFYKDAHFYSVAEINHFLLKSGFKMIQSVQAILPGDNIKGTKVKSGYGEGSFVVIKAVKSQS